jgi:hypothetical protein
MRVADSNATPSSANPTRGWQNNRMNPRANRVTVRRRYNRSVRSTASLHRTRCFRAGLGALSSFTSSPIHISSKRPAVNRATAFSPSYRRWASRLPKRAPSQPLEVYLASSPAAAQPLPQRVDSEWSDEALHA